jgi:hypothetical protein
MGLDNPAALRDPMVCIGSSRLMKYKNVLL